MQGLPAEPDASESSHLCSFIWQCPYLPLGIQGDQDDMDKVKSQKPHEKNHIQDPFFPLLLCQLGIINRYQLTGYISQEKQHERRVPLASLANEISQAILSRTGERYEPGTAREVFGLWGLAGGATDDWYITQVARSTFC